MYPVRLLPAISTHPALAEFSFAVAPSSRFHPHEYAAIAGFPVTDIDPEDIQRIDRLVKSLHTGEFLIVEHLIKGA